MILRHLVLPTPRILAAFDAFRGIFSANIVQMFQINHFLLLKSILRLSDNEMLANEVLICTQFELAHFSSFSSNFS